MTGHSIRPIRPRLIAALLLGICLLPTLAWAGDRGAGAHSDTPTATPAPGPGLCTLSGERTLGATQVERNQALSLQLTLRADCPVEARGRADILLVYDRSASMSEGGKYAAALAAVDTFLDNVDFTRHRVGLVPFSDAPSVTQTLTERLDRLRRALANSPPPTGSTDISRALSVADTELASTARAEAVGVIVLLTDGQSNAEAMVKAADRAKARGTVIFTIGLGADASQAALQRVASSPSHYDYAPGPEALTAVYQRVASIIRTFTVTDAHLLHSPLAGIEYLAGSGQPAEPQTGSTLDWRHAFLPPDGITVTYQVRLTRTGPQDLGPAWAQYVDGDGVLRRFDFPPLSVEVVPPVIRSYYLPGLYRNQCLAAARHADVVLALDTSNSMAEDGKLGEAVAAATTFVGLLRLPADQAAIVGFYGQAELLQPLTGNRALLESRLSTLTTASGTRIDKGIDVAVSELLGPRHADGNQRVLVLLSDGRQLEESGLPVASANFARRMGVTVFAIALGDDADEATLRAIAGSPGRFFRAGRPQDLGTIYTQIAGVVACR